MQWDLGSYLYKPMAWEGFTKGLMIWLGLVEWVGFELEEKEKVIAGSVEAWVDDLRELKQESEV